MVTDKQLQNAVAQNHRHLVKICGFSGPTEYNHWLIVLLTLAEISHMQRSWLSGGTAETTGQPLCVHPPACCPACVLMVKSNCPVFQH